MPRRFVDLSAAQGALPHLEAALKAADAASAGGLLL